MARLSLQSNNMKKTLLFLVIISSAKLYAQSETEAFGKIALSVVMPDNSEYLERTQLSKIETKITQIVTSSGLAASGFDKSFVIYPKFEIYNTSVVENGIEDLTVTECEITLFVKQTENNIIYATVSKQLKGFGKTKGVAITSAISKIPVNDPEFSSFINTAKNKIIAYYNTKCSDIILKADALAKKQDYGQALNILLTIPEEVDCYNKVQERTVAIYKAYQNQLCAKQILQAKAILAQKNYSEALNILGDIDPSTTCFVEAKALIKSSQTEIDAEQQKQWNLRLKMYDDRIALEKQRIEAAKEIAISYAQAHPKTVTYYTLIK